MGFAPYIGKLNTDGKITSETKALLLHIYASVNVEEDVIIDDLKNDLITSFNPETANTSDPFYCYLYNIALEIYNEYYGPGSVHVRGDCDFKDWIKHVFKSAGIGAGIGAGLGEFIQDLDSLFVVQLVGFTIKVGGEIVGGAIGAIVGIFTFDYGGCSDCHPVDMIAFTTDDNCDLTRTLRAVGAGPDALAYEWRITQGGSTVTITTLVPLITITQIVNEAPVSVSVASLCLPDGESNPSLTPFTETKDFDLSTDASSFLGQPGTVTITTLIQGIWEEDDPIHGGGGPTPPPNQVGGYTTFLWQNSNEALGNITHTVSIYPASLGNVVELSNGEARVQWAESGSGSFRVTALNTCSGLTSFTSAAVK